MSAPFRAMFDGVCAAGCENRVHPGDLVRYDADDQLVHSECAPADESPELADVVCGVCWVIPCRC